mgnify:CR=1 FL=1
MSSANDDVVLSIIQAISKEAKQLHQDMLKAKRNTKKATTEEIDKLKNLLKQEGDFQPIITVKGKEYGFIPNLNEITVGEQADIDTLISDWQKMDKVMAIIYRPITYKKSGKYLIKEYQEEIKKSRIKNKQASGNLVKVRF